MSEQTSRKRLIGEVVSNKMDKTVVVTITRKKKDRRYKKYMTSSMRYKAHDPENSCQEHDRVEIEETRPLSKEKRWRVVRIVERAV